MPGYCRDLVTQTGVAGSLSVALIVSVAAITTTLAQEPKFEVASVKRNVDSPTPLFALDVQPGGRVTALNIPLRELIIAAYAVQGYQILGGPSWINSDRFDIQAKAATDTTTPEQNRAMMRSLLAERFKLVVHQETREMPAYALVVARRDGTLGRQLIRSGQDCGPAAVAARARGGPAAPPRPGEGPTCGMFGRGGSLLGGGVTMGQLAANLSRRIGRQVFNRTGLDGGFDFTLEWIPDPSPADANALAAGAAEGASLLTALQEQLGLRLDAERASTSVIMIDSVDPPTPN